MARLEEVTPAGAEHRLDRLRHLEDRQASLGLPLLARRQDLDLPVESIRLALRAETATALIQLEPSVRGFLVWTQEEPWIDRVQESREGDPVVPAGP